MSFLFHVKDQKRAPVGPRGEVGLHLWLDLSADSDWEPPWAQFYGAWKFKNDSLMFRFCDRKGIDANTDDSGTAAVFPLPGFGFSDTWILSVYWAEFWREARM